MVYLDYTKGAKCFPAVLLGWGWYIGASMFVPAESPNLDFTGPSSHFFLHPVSINGDGVLETTLSPP